MRQQRRQTRRMSSSEEDTVGAIENPSEEKSGKTRPYTHLPLSELCGLIADSDMLAMQEFMEHRRPFEIATGERVGFVPYVKLLRKQRLETYLRDSLVECAFDLLTDHFTNIPTEEDHDGRQENRQDLGGGHQGEDCAVDNEDEDQPLRIDCRHYYRGYVSQVASDFRKVPPVGEVERELREAEHLRRFVLHQLKYCFKEAPRMTNPLLNRYEWKMGQKKSLWLWFPKSFGGSRRKKWLEEHVGHPDLSNPWEKERVQDLIDQSLGPQVLVPADGSIANRLAGDLPAPDSTVRKAELKKMRCLIADEKAARVNDQRRAIRNLGKKKLRELVLAVLENWDTEEISGKDLARQFGLSPPTLSRFAGKNRKKGPPDLVVNIACIMKADANFMKAAREAGFLDRVLGAAENGSEENSHGT